MKNVFFVLILLGVFIQISQAQNLQNTEKVKSGLKNFQLNKMPVLTHRFYSCCSGIALSNGEAISLSGCRHRSELLEIPSDVLSGLMYYNSPRPKVLLPDRREYFYEDLMKLPATNTYDIIKILDTDRRLTNW